MKKRYIFLIACILVLAGIGFYLGRLDEQRRKIDVFSLPSRLDE